MAKKPATPKAKTTAKPLTGRRVAFVGNFGYRDHWRKDATAWARSAGATVVESWDDFDLMVIGEGRGGKPPGDVAKIQKRLPAVEEATFAQFAAMALPDPEEFTRELRGSKKREYDDWSALENRRRFAAVTIDLTGTDLRSANLYGAKLEGVTLDGADLRGAKAEYAHFGPIRGANFDGIDAPNIYLMDADDCTFRKAALQKAWLFWGMSKTLSACDFSAAEMPLARLSPRNGSTVSTCKFRDTNLADAELEATAFERCDFGKANMSHIRAHKASFTDCVFAGANLTRADLRETSLKNADLRNANLTNAALGRADLTGANVAGANFAGAVLIGANLKGVDFSKAKNYTPPVARTAGPKVKEFVAGAAGSKSFATTAEVELGKGEHATLSLSAALRGGQTMIHAASRYYRDGHDAHNWITAPTVEQGLLNMADRWPNATLRLDTVKASGSKNARGPKLQELAAAAWAEAFGVHAATTEGLDTQKQSQHDAAMRDRDALAAQMRKRGGEVWKALDYRERDRIDLRGIDLSGAFLGDIDLWRKTLTDAKFAGADLIAAKLWNCDARGADFTGASMGRIDLQGSRCEKAVFANAALGRANLQNAKLQGADFTGAILTTAELDKAQFDEHTKFPAGFKIPDAMVWKGKGARPGLKATKTVAVGSMDFGTFFAGLPKQVDAGRMQKATAMLKAERFQLFADVTDEAIVGIVKSQTSKDLVYSCRLASDGHFCCGTQNLKPCGGLQGALCKHLLVLIVGLAKAGKLDPATAAAWVAASRAQQPKLDADALSATFLKYKGAEAGEVDWRPTETIPEDFYAM